MSDAATTWDREADVVVMGTGAGGLLAALTAHHRGASVIVLEKSSAVGGTTAVSGGVIWIPGNHHMVEVGCSDDRAEALGYIERIADGKGDLAMIERYVDVGPEMVRWVEANSAVTFTSIPTYPDYHPELPGGRTGGRSLDNGLFDTNLLGEWKPKLRKNPTTGKVPIAIPEAMEWGVFWNPFGIPYKVVSERAKNGIVHGGAGLCGKLLRALLDRGVEPLMETPGEDLVVDATGAVIGIVARGAEGPIRIRAKKGVILASGGFEWDAQLCRDFLAPELRHPVSPPHNTGDALRMTMKLGVELGAMNECWWTPAVDIPGELYDGTQLHRCEFSVRCLPHSIIVNARGKRFTNEAGNYNDMTKPFFDHESVRYERANLPAFLVVDQQYLDKYILVSAMNGRPIPDYITQADTLEELAAKVGIDAEGLGATVERFNGFAATGVDADFGRGWSAFDRFYGDPRSTPNPNLGTIAKAPFYALPIHPGAMGTKGGPRTTPDGQVRRVGGAPIPGLYAVGNAAASPAGHGYPGAGITIGAAMVFGWLAAQHATERAD